jgi:hypothetical protein
MAGVTESVREFVRPPFANYDVVVYFGCGLFALPLIYHYLVEPSKLRFPRFNFDVGLPFANEAISTLSLLFAVYLLGHIIAYSSSILIEKAIDTFFGKVSSAILLSNYGVAGNKQELIKSWMYDRLKEAFNEGRRTQNGLRILAHIPVLPLYLMIDVIGGFDYYRSRVPKHVMFLARKRLSESGYGPIGLREPWYKTLEHVVINNNPSATARMYNYLVISGLFRSLSLLFLGCLWAELYYGGYYALDGHYPLRPLMSDSSTSGAHLLAIGLLYVAYGFSISSYMKIQLRYAEEAIFAFVLGGGGKP